MSFGDFDVQTWLALLRGQVSDVQSAVGALSQKTLRFKLFIESGTWECPAPDTLVSVICIGGGSGGIATTAASTVQAGGTSSFGTLLTASGGVGATSSTASATIIPIDAGFFGFGDGGITGLSAYGRRGNIASGTFSVSADQVVTVGAGSASVPSSNRAGKGGAVFVFWWE